jgi:hypothetical protein
MEKDKFVLYSDLENVVGRKNASDRIAHALVYAP